MYSYTQKIEKTINMIVSSREYQDYIKKLAEERREALEKETNIDLDYRINVRKVWASVGNRNKYLKRKNKEKLGKG